MFFLFQFVYSLALSICTFCLENTHQHMCTQLYRAQMGKGCALWLIAMTSRRRLESHGWLKANQIWTQSIATDQMSCLLEMAWGQQLTKVKLQLQGICRTKLETSLRATPWYPPLAHKSCSKGNRALDPLRLFMRQRTRHCFNIAGGGLVNSRCTRRILWFASRGPYIRVKHK